MFYLTLRNLSLHQELFEYLRQQSYYTIAGYALFLFLGYESVARVRQRELRECLCAANGGLGRCYLGLAVPLALLALLHFLLFLGVNCLVFAISGVRFAPFWGNMLASTTLYFCLAPLAGAALGAGLATLCKGNRLAAYCAFLFLLLMTTSYLYKVWWMPYAFAGKEAGTPWTNFLYAINDFFTLTPYGLVDNLHEDYLYGLPAEPPRWCLALFWLCAGCLATVQSLPRAQRRRGVSAGLAILLLLGLGGYAIRGGLPRLDMRPNGLVMYNPETYMRWDKNGVPQSVPAEEGGFAIERIEGRLTVGNRSPGTSPLPFLPWRRAGMSIGLPSPTATGCYPPPWRGSPCPTAGRGIIWQSTGNTWIPRVPSRYATGGMTRNSTPTCRGSLCPATFRIIPWREERPYTSAKPSP